jgi:hypothetical protein
MENLTFLIQFFKVEFWTSSASIEALIFLQTAEHLDLDLGFD